MDISLCILFRERFSFGGKGSSDDDDDDSSSSSGRMLMLSSTIPVMALVDSVMTVENRTEQRRLLSPAEVRILDLRGGVIPTKELLLLITSFSSSSSGLMLATGGGIITSAASLPRR